MDQQLENNLDQLYNTDKEIILLGDINVNALNDDHVYHRLRRYTSSLEMSQLIKEITRPASRTCLDHVYISRPQHFLMTKVLNIGVSDHLPVCIVRKYRKRSIQNIEKTIKHRKWKIFSEQAFQEDLEKAPGNVLDMYDDPNDAIQFFNRTFLDVADDHVPLLSKRVKRQRQPAWMTAVIVNNIVHRDRLLKKARELDTPEVWKEYREQRNKTFRSIRRAKSRFFHDSLQNSRDSLEFWKTLKNAVGSTESLL